MYQSTSQEKQGQVIEPSKDENSARVKKEWLAPDITWKDVMWMPGVLRGDGIQGQGNDFYRR